MNWCVCLTSPTSGIVNWEGRPKKDTVEQELSVDMLGCIKGSVRGSPRDDNCVNKTCIMCVCGRGGWIHNRKKIESTGKERYRQVQTTCHQYVSSKLV